jgi:Leucine-rich repeat (LRR) protein
MAQLLLLTLLFVGALADEPCPARCLCSPVALICNGAALPTIPVVPSYAASLLLNRNSITSLPANAFPGAPQLASMQIAFNRITFVHRDALAGLALLSDLLISNNAITEFPAGFFDHVPLLSALDFTSNAVTRFPAFPPRMQNMSVIYASRNQISSISRADLAPVAVTILTLSLHLNLLGPVNGGQGIPADLFADCRQLSAVMFSSNDLTTLPDELFAPVQHTLNSVALHDNKLTVLPASLLRTIAVGSLRSMCV